MIKVYIEYGRLPGYYTYPFLENVCANPELFFYFYFYSILFILFGVALNTWFVIKNIKVIKKVIDKSTIFFLINIFLWILEFKIDPLGFQSWLWS